MSLASGKWSMLSMFRYSLRHRSRRRTPKSWAFEYQCNCRLYLCDIVVTEEKSDTETLVGVHSVFPSRQRWSISKSREYPGDRGGNERLRRAWSRGDKDSDLISPSRVGAARGFEKVDENSLVLKSLFVTVLRRNTRERRERGRRKWDISSTPCRIGAGDADDWSPPPTTKVDLSIISSIGLKTENRYSREEKGEKAVQGRVHNQIRHREGRIETETELHGHEAISREKSATMLEIATEQEEKNAQELMGKTEE